MRQSYTSRATCFNRTEILMAILLLNLWVASGFSQSQNSPAPAGLPDVVYVLGDDQAWSDYGFMGHPHIKTPNLDRLAKESMLYTRGYVPDSLCRPSLATMITGLYPHQHGIVGNDPPPSVAGKAGRGGSYRDAAYQKDIEKYLSLHIDKLETLPDRLKKLGYTSFQSGKWWEGNFARGGFDAGMTHGDHSRGARHGDKGLEIGRTTMKPIEEFVASARQANKPYFLWYAPMLPHTPHDPPTELLEKYKGLAPTEPIAKYWAMCERFDNSIGELLKIIEQQGRPQNTLIVFACDNGWINLPNQSAYAPKSKRSQYDGGVRTPIMFHWPAKLQPQRNETDLASTIDLVPTVMSLVGLQPDKDLPGVDLSQPGNAASRGPLFGEIFEHDIVDMDQPRSSLMYRWVIDGQRKLIVPEPARVPKGSVELYDLAADPWEKENLAESHSDEVRTLREKLDGWWR
ncbi:MAG: sulfatase [Pirellulaceae bacterium]|nr:sulfatase [Pirellulaceae bacterium]